MFGEYIQKMLNQTLQKQNPHTFDQTQSQFFKLLPSESNLSPSLQNYQTILQILRNKKFLYVDFNKKQQDSLILLEKTLPPTKHHQEQHQDEDLHEPGQEIQMLGHQHIVDVNNLSKPTYKMIRYLSQGKRLLSKKKKFDQMESDFIKDFQVHNPKFINKLKLGPVYRRIQKRNQKPQYSDKISPEKLQEYLESKEYFKVERRLQKSQKQLQRHVVSVKELKQMKKERQKSQMKQTRYRQKQLQNHSNRLNYSLDSLDSNKQKNSLINHYMQFITRRNISQSREFSAAINHKPSILPQITKPSSKVWHKSYTSR